MCSYAPSRGPEEDRRALLLSGAPAAGTGGPVISEGADTAGCFVCEVWLGNWLFGDPGRSINVCAEDARFVGVRLRTDDLVADIVTAHAPCGGGGEQWWRSLQAAVPSRSARADLVICRDANERPGSACSGPVGQLQADEEDENCRFLHEFLAGWELCAVYNTCWSPSSGKLVINLQQPQSVRRRARPLKLVFARIAVLDGGRDASSDGVKKMSTTRSKCPWRHGRRRKLLPQESREGRSSAIATSCRRLTKKSWSILTSIHVSLLSKRCRIVLASAFLSTSRSSCCAGRCSWWRGTRRSAVLGLLLERIGQATDHWQLEQPPQGTTRRDAPAPAVHEATTVEGPFQESRHLAISLGLEYANPPFYESLLLRISLGLWRRFGRKGRKNGKVAVKQKMPTNQRFVIANSNGFCELQT